ncbi:MAG: AAA family ATPase [Cellvibrionaceae bacterium]
MQTDNSSNSDQKILIFGNSGSGKSTLARALSQSISVTHLDLDTLAWLPTNPPQRMPLSESASAIELFISNNTQWIIEGCYADLLELASSEATHIIYLDLSVSDCVKNARERPWEPHKYPSKQAQDENLNMLINWIRDYENRNDVFSKISHHQLFNHYHGKKTRYTTRPSQQEIIEAL